MRTLDPRRLVPAVLVTLGVLAGIAHAALSPELTQALEKSTYVYIASERKDGSYGTSAEIWFMAYEGAVWVASPPTTWRVKRIRAGRTAARIAVGTKDGPTFTGDGLDRDATRRSTSGSSRPSRRSTRTAGRATRRAFEPG